MTFWEKNFIFVILQGLKIVPFLGAKKGGGFASRDSHKNARAQLTEVENSCEYNVFTLITLSGRSLSR